MSKMLSLCISNAAADSAWTKDFHHKFSNCVTNVDPLIFLRVDLSDQLATNDNWPHWFIHFSGIKYISHMLSVFCIQWLSSRQCRNILLATVAGKKKRKAEWWGVPGI